MKKNLFISALVSLFGLLVLCSVNAQDQDTNLIFGQLRNELLNSKVAIKDVNSITQTLKSLVKQGGTKAELKSMVLNLTQKGFADGNLNNYLESVSTLVASGAKVNEAGGVVLGAIDQGLVYGFKDGDSALAAKVQEAVKKKKAELLEEMKEKPTKQAGEKEGL